MRVMRRGLFEILASVLLFSVLGAVLFASIYSAAGHPQKIKNWFSNSGIYDQLVTNAINDAQKTNSASVDTTAISLSDPAIQDIARQVFSTGYVQQNVETVIDSNYSWLQGKSDTPSFKLDLSQQKQQFAQAVGEKVQTYLRGLSVCSTQQLVQLQASGPINPLALACRPAAIDPSVEASKITQEVATGPFIDQAVITAQTLGPDYGLGSDQPYYKTFSVAPAAYSVGKIAPLILVLVAVVAIIGLFITAVNRRTAIRRIAFVSFVAGLLLLAVKLSADYVLNHIQAKVFTNQNASELQQPITSILHQAEQSAVRIDLYAGIGLLVIAAAIVVYLFVTRTHKNPPAPQQDTAAEPQETQRPKISIRRDSPSVSMDIKNPGPAPSISESPKQIDRPAQQDGPRPRNRFIQ